MNRIKTLLCLIAWSFAAATFAQGNASAPAPTAASAPAAKTVEEEIRNKVEKMFDAKANSVTKMPFGLYEVVVGTEIFYVDQGVNYVFAGRVIDAKTREDFTAAKRDELMRVDFKSLPLDQAMKVVRGNGSRVFATFEDPNCGYCKKLHRDLAKLDNVTIYTFLYPILSQDSFEKSRAIWCAKDRVAAWDEWMAKGKLPPAAAEDCKHPLQQTLALGQKLEVSGTPTLIFTDGRRIPGAVGLARVETMLKEAAAKKP